MSPPKLWCECSQVVCQARCVARGGWMRRGFVWWTGGGGDVCGAVCRGCPGGGVGWCGVGPVEQGCAMAVGKARGYGRLRRVSCLQLFFRAGRGVGCHRGVVSCF